LYRVVGFEVEPKSIDSKRITVSDDGTCTIQSGQETQKINPKGKIFEKQIISIKFNNYILEENKLTMTYEIEWTSSETRWASR
jgi:hypothetical protein